MRNICTGEESVAIVMHMQYMQRMSSWRSFASTGKLSN